MALNTGGMTVDPNAELAKAYQKNKVKGSYGLADPMGSLNTGGMTVSPTEGQQSAYGGGLNNYLPGDGLRNTKAPVMGKLNSPTHTPGDRSYMEDFLRKHGTSTTPTATPTTTTPTQVTIAPAETTASGYDMTGWSAADQNLPQEARDLIAQYKAGWHSATTAQDKAYYNQMAEAIRQKYGNYTGGTSGSGYTKLADYEKAYISPYEQQMNDLLTKINESKFEYDYTQDPSYQAYANAMQRAGQSAAETGLATTAAATGGMPSSYAAAVANQALQQYAKKATDMIPTLEQNAYSRYQDGLNNLYNQAGLYNTLDNTLYGRYADDRGFDYGQYRDTTADSQWQKEYDFADDQFEYQKKQDAINNYLNYAMNGISGAGYKASSGSGGSSAGTSYSGSSGSSGGSSGSRGSSGSNGSSSSASLTSGQKEMLDRWYSSHDADGFDATVAAAIKSGKLTKQQAAAYYKSKGL